VDFLMIVDVPAIKLASGSLTDFALLKHAASYGKPLILSTGRRDLRASGCRGRNAAGGEVPFALLHCTAAYPVQNYGELNLLAIAEMRARYPDTIIGWSGHDPGISMALVAYAYGARIIEKHVTLNRANKGTDHAFSLEPKGLQTLCEDLKRAHLASGDGMKRMYESERGPLSKMRRMETPFGRKVTGQLYDAH
jgi:sialic acid synthase